MANTVRILITAKDDISSELDKIRDKATLLSKTDIGKGMLQGAGIAAFGAIKGAAEGALESVVNFGIGSIEAAKEQQVGIARLNASLQANVDGWNGNTDAIEKNIEAMVRTTGFSDGDLRDSLARIVGATHDVNKAWAVQSTAMDLARFKGISLADASDALIKVEGGQYRALKGLGIVLKDGATQTEALAAVQKVAGGQMAAYAETAAGKTEILNNRLQDFQEELGNHLTPALLTATQSALGFMDALDASSDLTLPDRLKGLGDALSVVNPLMWTANLNAGFMGDAMKHAADQAQASGSSVDDAAGSIQSSSHEMGKSFDLVGRKSNNLARDVRIDTKNMRWDYEKLSGYLLKDYTSNVDKAMGIVEARQKLHVAKTDQDKAQAYADLAELGALNKKDYANWIATLERLAAHTKGRVHKAYVDAIADIRRLEGAANARIDVNVYYREGASKNNDKGKAAAGSPIAPYSTTLIGENGPELLTMGTSGGRVFPSVGGAMGGGGGGSVSINVSTPLMTPGSSQALASTLAPLVAKELQRQQLIARR